MIFVWNPGIWKVWVNYETAMYSVCWETNYIMTHINDIYDVTWLFTWCHFIICFNTICQNVLLCPPWLHCCRRHSSGKTSRQVKYRGLPKGGVIKGCDRGGVIKDTCMYSYQGCKNSVLYSKYIIILFIKFSVDRVKVNLMERCNTDPGAAGGLSMLSQQMKVAYMNQQGK